MKHGCLTMNKIDIVHASLIQQQDKQYCVTTKL